MRWLRWPVWALVLLSTLLFVVNALLWVRSHWIGDEITAGAPTSSAFYHVGVLSGRGIIGLGFGWDRSSSRLSRRRGRWKTTPSPIPVHVDAARLNGSVNGWALEAGDALIGSFEPGGDRLILLVLPCWVIALFTIVPPAAWVGRRLAKPRRRGICLVCGYDLRASKNICPECGTPVPKPKYDAQAIAANLSALERELETPRDLDDPS